MSLRMRGWRENSAACCGDRVNTWGGVGVGREKADWDQGENSASQGVLGSARTCDHPGVYCVLKFF